MLFYLTTLNLAKFLHATAPTLTDDADVNVIAAVEAWKNADFLCRNYILNGLDNVLYNVYCTIETSKELWESLEKKYKTEDAGSKKFVVGKFLEYKMVDAIPVINQVQDLQVIIHDIHAEGMVISESFQVAAIIEKLPPTWKEFKNYLKHKRKEMSVEDLILRLRIEEDNRNSEKKHGGQYMASRANVVEQKKTFKGSNKRKAVSGDNGNSKKFTGKCYNCDKPGHRAKDCCASRKRFKPNKP